MSFIKYDKIKNLISTEKSNQSSQLNKYHFKVDSSCCKKEVSSLIKKIFNVDVEMVNIINSKSKIKRFKGKEGNTKAFKKAIVTLKEGQSINLGL
ncbi:MAG: 50S ribosomal protein L23 [Rickettsiales bacterium]|jgi:large subunit ribosomal protein L23|nr:50S ribosomal protein L23 [Rickettsiales bacterium]